MTYFIFSFSPNVWLPEPGLYAVLSRLPAQRLELFSSVLVQIGFSIFLGDFFFFSTDHTCCTALHIGEGPAGGEAKRRPQELGVVHRQLGRGRKTKGTGIDVSPPASGPQSG